MKPIAMGTPRRAGSTAPSTPAANSMGAALTAQSPVKPGVQRLSQYVTPKNAKTAGEIRDTFIPFSLAGRGWTNQPGPLCDRAQGGVSTCPALHYRPWRLIQLRMVEFGIGK